MNDVDVVGILLFVDSCNDPYDYLYYQWYILFVAICCGDG